MLLDEIHGSVSLEEFDTKRGIGAEPHPLEASRNLLKNGIAVSYSLPLATEGTNWKVSFEKPADILLVGSRANKLSVKAQVWKKIQR
jgi:hypothetical protein